MAFFGDFFGGGFGGQERFSSQQPKPEADTTKLYEALGVEKTANQKTIKKAYRKMALKHHPDRGGNADKFKEVNAAYEILSNDEKRKVYDKYGLEGLKQGGMGGGEMSDIFEMFFNGRGGGGTTSKRSKQQLKPTVRKMEITLKDVNNGTMKYLIVERKTLCSDCNGEGGKEITVCRNCKGRGIQIKMLQLGPGMYSQSQVPCKNCDGSGENIDEKNICKLCRGKKLMTKKEKVEVPIAKGLPDEHQIHIPHKGNEHPEYRTGDLVVVVKVKEHSIFSRKGADLYFIKDISLIEALRGFSFNITLLDNRKVTVKTKIGEIITHKNLKMVDNLGLPVYDHTFSSGNLYIEFNVEFPSSLSQKQLEVLATVLPQPKLGKSQKTMNDYELKKAVMVNRSEMQGEDEDEQGPNGQRGQRMECQSQ